MDPRSNKTLTGRVFGWLRGYFSQPDRSRPSTSSGSRQDTSGSEDQAAVLGDLADSDISGTTDRPSDRGVSRSDATADRSAGLADGGRFDDRPAADAPDADVEEQEQPSGATGASTDEFGSGGYEGEHPDKDDIEEAAEAETDGRPADDPNRDQSGLGASSTGNYGAGNLHVGSTGSLGTESGAAQGDDQPTEDLDLGNAQTIPPGDVNQSTDDSEARPADVSASDQSGTLGVADLEDASGDEVPAGSQYLPDSGDVDDANTVHDAVGGPEAGDQGGEFDDGATDRSGVIDESMEGDTDYVVSGYPSEALDIDIKDTDDVGVYDAESMDDDDEDDDADFSEDTGELGLADSETVDDGVPDGASESTGAMSPSTDDIGVGGPDEVDDDSMIGPADNATSFGDPDVGDYGPEGASEDEADRSGAAPSSSAGGLTSRTASTAASQDDVGEGVQSFASTADRDVLADIQNTGSAGAPAASGQEVGGLGSDESPADDPTSVGMDPAVESSEPTGGVSDTPVTGATADTTASAPTAPVATPASGVGEQAYAGALRGDGTKTCPADYPIKGNGNSRIYHVPGRASYDGTIPEWCFATEEDAVNAGFRVPKR